MSVPRRLSTLSCPTRCQEGERCTPASWCSPKSWTICPGTVSVAAWPAATTRSSRSPASIAAWRSLNSPTDPACATSRLARPPPKLYHMGIRGRVSRNTLAHAVRGWQPTSRSASSTPPVVCMPTTTFPAAPSTRSSTIDLCLFPWAPFRSTKAAVKLHTLLDLHGSIPAFIHICDGKLHDVNVMDMLLPEAFYIMDRPYLDFRPSPSPAPEASSS